MTPRAHSTDHSAFSPRTLASPRQVNDIRMKPQLHQARGDVSERQNILISRRRRSARRDAR